MKVKQILIMILVVLIAFYIGYNFRTGYFKGVIPTQKATESQEEHHSPPSVIIEPGSAVEEASYVIFKDDEGWVYAKNGDTGEIVKSSDNASEVIQYAIDQLTNGGKVFIKAGTYHITSPIVPRFRLWLSGEGDGTVLQQDGDVSVIEKTDSRVGFVTISDMKILGNYQPYATWGLSGGDVGYGINLAAYRSIFERLHIRNFGKDCIRIAYDGSTYSTGIKILNSFIGGISSDLLSGGYGIYFESPGTTDHWVAYNIISYTGEAGVRITSASEVESNRFQLGGVEITYLGSDIDINDNFFDNINEHGIFINASDGAIKRIRIFDNTFKRIGLAANNTYDAIYAKGSSSTKKFLDSRIFRNTFTIHLGSDNKVRYYINLPQYEDDNEIVENQFHSSGYGTGIVNISGSNTVVKRNIGYVTENSGTETITAGNDYVTVNHGLDGISASSDYKVVVTPTSDMSGITWWITKDIDSFTIHINTTSGSDKTFDWYAEI